jgi:hypothetical protein
MKAVPRWLGVADVTVAVLLATSAIYVAARCRHDVSDADRLAALRGTQVLLGLIPALLILFFLVGNGIDWIVLVMGLAWRGWLLAYTLPYLMAVRREA